LVAPYSVRAPKLSAELLVEEYRTSFSLRTVIDRWGVIAGPWQMGKVDQGVFTYWVLAHRFGRSLRYIGFDGTGRQVRDLVHIQDVVALLDDQLLRPDHWDGVVVNAGGGRSCSLSLLETTSLCQELTGREVPVAPAAEERPGDVPVYISDCRRLMERFEWSPRHTARDILRDIAEWSTEHESQILSAL